MTTDPRRKLSFNENLDRLSGAFQSGWHTEAGGAAATLKVLSRRRSVVLGSGASRSVAMIAERCLRSYLGAQASAITPWSLGESREDFDAAMIFSASGDNADAKAAVDQSLAAGYDPLIVFTQNPEAAILRDIQSYEYGCEIVGAARDRHRPEREGFLGILSFVEALAAFTRVLSVALDVDWSSLPGQVNQWLAESVERMTALASPLAELARCRHVVALAGYWGEPVLADLESKWVEGGLGWIEISEFRNFSHGRYMNSFAHRGDTAILTLGTPDDAPAEEAIVRILSDHFEIIRLRTPSSALFGAWDLLIQMLHLYARVADLRGITVTAPLVPDEGRRLFSAAGVYPHLQEAECLEEKLDALVRTKREAARHDGLDETTAEKAVPRPVVRASFALAVTDRYGAIGLDFDGTLVPLRSGDDVPPPAICAEVERLVGNHVPVGIFTGRGKSVIRGLREGITPSAWPGITSFLYNGALRWRLDLDSPNVLSSIDDVSAVLVHIKDMPRDLSKWFGQIDPSSFGCQVTINLDPATPDDAQTRIVDGLSATLANLSLSVASSGRSIDIFPTSVSKRAALKQWGVVERTKRGQRRILRIGDRGDRAGNDHVFLQGPGGFSVDRIDWSPFGCFPADLIVLGAEKGPDLTELLLRSLRIDSDGRIMMPLLSSA